MHLGVPLNYTRVHMSISLCRDAGFIAQKPASLQEKSSKMYFCLRDAGIFAKTRASLQGKVKVTKVTQILGDFAHFSMEFDHF